MSTKTEIKPLVMEPERGRDDCSFEFRYGAWIVGARKERPWLLTMYGAGFEATTHLNRDDLIDIRNWLDEAIGEDQ